MVKCPRCKKGELFNAGKITRCIACMHDISLRFFQQNQQDQLKDKSQESLELVQVQLFPGHNFNLNPLSVDLYGKMDESPLRRFLS